MTEVDTLKEQLVRMPKRAYGALLRQVEAERRAEAERQESENLPHPDMTRDEFAYWFARRNFDDIESITRVFYFPTGAPPNEVRLLECNDLLSTPNDGPMWAYPIEFGEYEIDFQIYLADASSTLLPDLLEGRAALPRGWVLDGYREFAFDNR